MSSVGFAVDELVVIVCAAIRRVVGPFVDALLSECAVRFGGAALRSNPRAPSWRPHWPERRPCHGGEASTLPRALAARLERHGDCPRHGRQAADGLSYIMESRPEEGL